MVCTPDQFSNSWVKGQRLNGTRGTKVPSGLRLPGGSGPSAGSTVQVLHRRAIATSACSLGCAHLMIPTLGTGARSCTGIGPARV